MKISGLTIVILFFVFLGCEKEESNTLDREFIPTDVFVKVKGYYTINMVFDFINSFEHDVEYIQSQVYTSDLPFDSLSYVLDYLNAKPYTNDEDSSFVSGSLNPQNKTITISLRFFDIKNVDYQTDWLESMEVLKLKPQIDGEWSGCIIYFHVPDGQEKLWEVKFEEYEFVEWAELNYFVETH